MTYAEPRDIVVTWPKSRPLESYLHELEVAAMYGQVINFKVPTLPKSKPRRCYMVHDGYIQGWNNVIDCLWRGEREVSRVGDEDRDGHWPAGWYIVRDPAWHALDEPIPMKGFQGWRYYG